MTKRHPETSTLPLADGTRLRVLHWAAPTPTKNVLLIQHGHGEHAGRYQTYVDELDALPLDIWAFDTRGHGHADGPRGHADDGLATMADDLGRVLEHVKEKVPGARIFLVGHSMGGSVVAHYASTRTPDPSIQALLISSPLMRIPRTPVVSVKLKIGGVLGSLVPRLTMPTGLDANGISSDPTEVTRYKNDPLVHDKASAALGASFLNHGEAAPLAAHKITLPVLAWHGVDDPIVSIDGTRAWVKALGSKDVTFKELEGSRHETHHETAAKRAVLFDLMREWLKPRLQA